MGFLVKCAQKRNFKTMKSVEEDCWKGNENEINKTKPCIHRKKNFASFVCMKTDKSNDYVMSRCDVFLADADVFWFYLSVIAQVDVENFSFFLVLFLVREH